MINYWLKEIDKKEEQIKKINKELEEVAMTENEQEKKWELDV